ncbi:glycosyltransferase [Thermoflexibacter ruber]|uniref:Glycosyltransferase involved in cell wall bisynthesis n=1 Tax=Thermoflexibacter ruber TaxID=1003 RepID=A0A1I2HZW4_9BACT|nr:glycosyltransferase [Thermoflexibacter ruber]SFF34126.1 Glycosyltransferase involved in cell wall bisynthesis [Thermoflexibacter ruber]
MKKPKILVLSPWYPSLANPVQGIFVQEQSALMTEDFDVRVLVGKPIYISRFDFLLQKIKTKYLKQNLPSKISPYPIAPPAAYEATYFYSPDLEAHHNLYLMEECFKTALNYWIEKENWKPDLIHAHVTNPSGIVASVLQQSFDIPFIITEHTSTFLLHEYSYYLSNRIIHNLLNANAVLVVSNHQKHLLLIHKIYRPIDVVGNLVDESHFFIKNQISEKSKFVILNTVRPSFEKDLKTFLYSVNELIKAGHEDIKVEIILSRSREDTIQFEDYEKICKDLGIAQFCHFHYIIPREEIVSFYQNCDVFVSSSIVESFGVAVCEALMCGKPIVSTANGGVEDMVNQENGIIVPLQDYQAMAEAILKIKNKEIVFDPQKIRESVVGKYGKEAFKNRLSKIYIDLVNLNQISSTT